MNLSKKIFGASAAYILGLRPMIEIKGNREEINAYKNVLNSSKSLYEALEEDSLNSVDQKLKDKKLAAHQFKAVTGTSWPF